MPSHSPFLWLLRKEWRELLVTKPWWALVLLMGPLTGVAFISAVHSYAELSTGGAGDTLAPLIGIWAPTFSACELAAVFLLPFVAIRIVGADRQSGALKLELQGPVPPLARILAKAVIALASWLVAMLPAALAVLLWRSYGGAIHLPELATLITGHILNAGLTVALGAAAASLSEHPSTAAILTLSVTVGTWILNFFAAIHGGLWERAAAFTPSAIVADFQHGLLRLATLLVSILLVTTGLALAGIWQRQGARTTRKTLESVAIVALTAVAIFAASHARPYWDTSENRANSLPKTDEQALLALPAPIQITARLAPEDPRRADLERTVFSKLRRLLPTLTLTYQSASSTGIFEQSASGYGEITYQYANKTETNRITTLEGVLESIYTVAQIHLPANAADSPFRGHPLTATPTGAEALFYGVWPGLVLLAYTWTRRR